MIVASVFGGLVFIITAYPRVNSWLNGKGAVQQVVQLGDATVVQVQSKKALRTYPGCYYYIIPSAFSIAANTPHLVYHWEKIDTGVEAYTTTTTTSDIFLLVQDSPEWIKQKVQVLLDGPYGYNARPEKYETVVLVAQGRGIAGVLPAASHIARISRRSRITRRIDLQWKLDQNDDEEWAEERLQTLIHLDPHRVRNDT
ncbi:FAD-binding domain-containing protein [Colletotrichum kahawae]|uniref:FAD-binding domain-containing protein n=1 Tax=Colletotrichum kahawae TaxID=34407 RepID=A0AAE0DC97_COLKA|nr:FAD-binding domain-containing protein [Colletotrichum kahawae]